MTSQCRTLLGPQVTTIHLEVARGRAWNRGLLSAPHISFWEGGICDRVTSGLGPFSLVIICSTLNRLLHSFAIRFRVFPPLLLASGKTRKVVPFHQYWSTPKVQDIAWE